MAPKNFDSGRFRGRRQISGGRKNIRNILYMCSMSLIRHKDNIFYRFYAKLVSNGKDKKLAIIAMIRKLIITLNSMIKNKAYFDPQYIWR